MTDKVRRRIHPGEILLEEFFVPTNYSIQEFSNCLHMDIGMVRDIMLERISVTPEIALKLSKGLGTSYHFWFNLQHAYDGEVKYLELKNSMHYFLLKVVKAEHNAFEMLKRAAAYSVGSRLSDKYRTALVKASSASEARLVMSENCGSEGKKVWLEPKTAHVQKIASCATGGEASVVIRSTNEEPYV